MSILDERLTRRLKTLNRWIPHPQPIIPPRRSLARRPRPRRPSTSSTAQSGPADGLPVMHLDQPSLSAALASLSDSELPPRAALLGLCQDGLPFVLDLADPSPGSILAAADPFSGKTSFLCSILSSAVRMSSSEQVAFHIIAAQPGDYSSLNPAPHFQSISPVEDPAVESLINELVTIVEARKRRGPADPAILLVIDDLASLLPLLDERAYNRLYWLIRHGPRYQVWTIASLPAPNGDQIDPRFLTAFRTKLFGYMQDERLACRLAADDSLSPRLLEQGQQFLIRYHGQWQRFWVCAPEQDLQSVEANLDEKGVEL